MIGHRKHFRLRKLQALVLLVKRLDGAISSAAFLNRIRDDVLIVPIAVFQVSCTAVTSGMSAWTANLVVSQFTLTSNALAP